MPDNMTPEQRSRTMSRIRSKNSQVELRLRRLLFGRGLRYRLHASDLPGRPDILFRTRKLAVFVDGDFWHGWRFHSVAPKLAPAWRAKIERNMARDAAANRALEEMGWKVVRIWEHELKTNPEACADRVESYVRGSLGRRQSDRRTA